MRGTGYRVRPCGRKFNSRNYSGVTDFDEIWYWKGAVPRMFCEFNIGFISIRIYVIFKSSLGLKFPPNGLPYS
jgi:hypothetical protein